MARGVNKVILIGNLGRDPETRYTQAGKPVTHFSVATNESWRDRQTGEQQERTEWHNVVCFSRLAEIASEYLSKGRTVYIEGSLRTSSWEKDGQKNYRTEIIANEMQMLGGRGQDGAYSEASGGRAQDAERAQNAGGPENAGGAQQAPVTEPSGGEPFEEDFDDDIPF